MYKLVLYDGTCVAYFFAKLNGCILSDKASCCSPVGCTCDCEMLQVVDIKDQSC